MARAVSTSQKSLNTAIAGTLGLLMFFRREWALELLRSIQEHVRPGGRAIVNVLTEGTTFMGMFDAENHYLFHRGEVEGYFGGWKILVARQEEFPAPEGAIKEFTTVIAEKPKQGLHK